MIVCDGMMATGANWIMSRSRAGCSFEVSGRSGGYLRDDGGTERRILYADPLGGVSLECVDSFPQMPTARRISITP